MASDLVFAWRTAVLAIAFVELILLAVALNRPLRNRTANLTLSVLLILLAGMSTPWMLGPSVYLYIYALVHGQWPARSWRTLISAMRQFGYQSGSPIVAFYPTSQSNEPPLTSPPFATLLWKPR